MNLWREPGFELLRCRVAFVSAGGEPELLLQAGEDAPLRKVVSEGREPVSFEGGNLK